MKYRTVRVATHIVKAFIKKAYVKNVEMDQILRLYALEGAAGLEPGTWVNKAKSVPALRGLLEKARTYFEERGHNVDPLWFTEKDLKIYKRGLDSATSMFYKFRRSIKTDVSLAFNDAYDFAQELLTSPTRKIAPHSYGQKNAEKIKNGKKPGGMAYAWQMYMKHYTQNFINKKENQMLLHSLPVDEYEYQDEEGTHFVDAVPARGIDDSDYTSLATLVTQIVGTNTPKGLALRDIIFDFLEERSGLKGQPLSIIKAFFLIWFQEPRLLNLRGGSRYKRKRKTIHQVITEWAGLPVTKTNVDTVRKTMKRHLEKTVKKLKKDPKLQEELVELQWASELLSGPYTLSKLARNKKKSRL